MTVTLQEVDLFFQDKKFPFRAVKGDRLGFAILVAGLDPQGSYPYFEYRARRVPFSMSQLNSLINFESYDELSFVVQVIREHDGCLQNLHGWIKTIWDKFTFQDKTKFPCWYIVCLYILCKKRIPKLRDVLAKDLATHCEMILEYKHRDVINNEITKMAQITDKMTEEIYFILQRIESGPKIEK
jgi:hypothetical protein